MIVQTMRASLVYFAFLVKGILILYLPSTDATGEGTSEDLEQMFLRMEYDTVEWAKHMETLILPENKCSQKTLENCSTANFNGCTSELPYATCPGAENRILRCGKGKEGGCSGLLDFTASRVSLAESDIFSSSINNSDDRQKDGICYSLPGDDFIIEAREQSSEYWDRYQVSPPWYYYGNEDGVFRMLPGSLEECKTGVSEFDPRVRPWYVAASSGPKDVVLVLDTSGSMGNQGRLDIMKEAAIRVINTLGVGDFFKVVEFDNKAQYVGGSPPEDHSGSHNDSNSNDYMWRATDENKKKMIDNINGLKANGGTYFYAGFDLAFQSLNRSIAAEKSSGCHRAILFLTDGESGESVNTLTTSINNQLNNLEANGSRPVIFTYSFGSGADDTIPKRIACENDGIWSSISDGGNLAESMGAYYKYFAYGLSGAGNENFVSWVAPYVFSTSGEMGTTASAPVYDRSVDPPVLAGVVGIDFSFNAMEKALGEDGQKSKDAILKRIVERSVATCPNLELTPCQLQSLREYGSGDSSNSAALCDNIVDANGNSCSTTALKSPLCKTSNNFPAYPFKVWNNDNNEYRTYEEKSCCTVGEAPREANKLTDAEVKNLVCSEKLDAGLIVAFVALGVVGLISILGAWWCLKKRRAKNASSTNENGRMEFPIASMKASTTHVANALEEEEIVVMPPPTAPTFPKETKN